MKRRCLGCLWTRLWNPNPRFSSFEQRYEWSAALFEHRKGASDPRCAPRLNDGKHIRAKSSRPAAIAKRSGAWRGPAPAIDRSLSLRQVWTQTEPIWLIPANLGMIGRDDQGDHRACVARSCRGILVFWGAKTFLSAILHITKRCQKLTKLTSLVPRRVFSKSVEGLFWFHNTFCFMPL